MLFQRLVVAGFLLCSSIAAAQPTVDGTVDSMYGAAVADDKTGDGNGKAEMDLEKMYLWHDASHLYIAFTITANITTSTTNWGKYIIYIDTTGDTKGATSDAWSRNVAVADPHKPEYSINTWVDQSPYGANRIQLWGWGSTGWIPQATGVAAAALKGSNTGSVIEYKVPLSVLGNPSKIWLEAWSTGSGPTDNAQDTINSPAEDWNATDWTAKAQLKVSTPYSLTAAADAGPDSSPDAGVPDASPSPDLTAAPDTSPAPDLTAAPDTSPAPDLTAAPDTSPASDSTSTPDAAPASDAVSTDSPLTGDSSAADSTVSSDGTSGDTSPASDTGAGGDISAAQDEGCACATTRATGAGGLLLPLSMVLLLLARRRRA